MRQKKVIANWKMNGQCDQISEIIKQLHEYLGFISESQVVIMPPSVYIPLVNTLLLNSKIKLGAQNIYPGNYGAFTGEVSGPMLKEFACSYVLVGHSERRHYFNEDENFVAQKFHHVKEHGMIPVLCVGESFQQRESGQTKATIAAQLNAIIDFKDDFANAVIAYEPVWAIGTGKTATPEQAQEIHQFIREEINKLTDCNGEQLTILYGGSVNETNSKALFSMPDIDGALVGGASLNAKQFVEIVKCIN